jgi:hypothetical protein
VDQTDEDGRVMVRPPRYWAPGAALTTREGRASITFFVQGAFGTYVERETVYTPDGPVPGEEVRKPVRTVLFGAAWAIGFRDIDLPAVPARPLAPPPIPE